MVCFLYSQGGTAREKLKEYIPETLSPFVLRLGEIFTPTVEFAMRLTDRVMATALRRDVDSVAQLKRLLHETSIVDPIVIDTADAAADTSTSAMLIAELQGLLRKAVQITKDGNPTEEHGEQKEENATLNGLYNEMSTAEPPVESLSTDEETTRVGGTVNQEAITSLTDELQRRATDKEIVKALLQALDKERSALDDLRLERNRLCLEKERALFQQESANLLQQQLAELELQAQAKIEHEIEEAKKVFIDIRAKTLEDMRVLCEEAKALENAFDAQCDETIRVVAANDHLHTLLRFHRTGENLPPDWIEELKEKYETSSLGYRVLSLASRGQARPPPEFPAWDLRQAAFVAPHGGIGAHLQATLLRLMFHVSGSVPARFDDKANTLWNLCRIEAAEEHLRHGNIGAAAAELRRTDHMTAQIAHPWANSAENYAVYDLAMKALLADVAASNRQILDL